MGTSAPQVDEHLRQQRNGSKWRVIKVHEYEPPFDIVRKAKVIYTFRNPLDVMASFRRLPRYSHLPWAHLARYPRQMSREYFWMKRRTGALMLKYEDMITDIPRAVATIARFLQLGHPPETVGKISAQVDPARLKIITDGMKPGTMDPDTELRASHISATKGAPNAWKTVLPSDWVKRTEILCEEMMVDAGYLADS